MQDIRTKKYTMAEFRDLPRNADGDLIDLYDHFLLFTDAQVELLSEDDHARYYDYQEELEYEMAMLKEEFGV